MEQEANELSPQFKYIEWHRYNTLDNFITSTIRTLDDCILSVFHRPEEDDRIAFGEMVALRNVRHILLDNRKWTEEKLKSNYIQPIIHKKMHQYLVEFDESKIELPDYLKNESSSDPKDYCRPTDAKPYVVEYDREDQE